VLFFMPRGIAPAVGERFAALGAAGARSARAERRA
jgi:hypothetical protein